MKDSYRGIFREGEFDRPFFVSVVPPSGRKPWPIKTEAAGRTYLEGQPLAVQLSYPVHYVPAGGRRPVASWVQDKAPVLFKTAETSQLRTACVIRRGGTRPRSCTSGVNCGGRYQGAPRLNASQPHWLRASMRPSDSWTKDA